MVPDRVGQISRGVTIQGKWSLEESQKHINVLQLTAVLFAVISFPANLSYIHVHLQLDNRATLSQINYMRGPMSNQLIQVTKVLWDFCMCHRIIITDEHIPRKKIIEADTKAIHFTDRKLMKPDYFQI